MAGTEDLKRTPLHALHVSMGAKMVPFAGYDMPVQYPAGVLKEHLHTRAAAGLFDVSHMGQRFIVSDDHEKTVAALEALTPGDFASLAPGRIRYSMLLTDAGGIIDDFMVTRPFEGQGTLGLIVNAGRKDIDDAHIEARLPPGVKLVKAEDRALLALQGPQAAPVLARHCPGSAAMTFMTARTVKIAGFACTISRSGYTGEDGYEISVHAEDAVRLAEILLAEPEVLPIGLGARDSLRLEAGLCLYGHDIDETTSPVEAALTWAIGKRRKMEKNFPGADRIMGELFDGAPRKRVGIQPLEKAPAREGTVIMNSAGGKIGTITSGGFGPAVNAPIAMGYVTGEFAADGTDVQLLVRGTPRPARIVPMPFAPHRYHRG